MDLSAWSNSIQGGGFVSATPFDGAEVRLGFEFLGLAQPADRWTTASLVPVGAASDNESRVLGYSPDLQLSVSPWDPLRFAAGYGLCVLGAGGRNILEAAGRGSRDLLHYAFLEARLRAP